jgi:serine/threonine protein kinase/WD40 repeat protein
MSAGDAKTPGIASPRNDSQGTLSQLRLIDRQCRQFEDEWRSGKRPSIETILSACPEASADPELHDLLLTELIVLEVMLRTDSGESLRLESFVERFSSSRVDIASAFQNGLSSLQPLPADIDEVPIQIGDYRIVQEIGRGGMGIVYEAEQVSLRRRVALKTLLKRGPGDVNHRRRFDREARAIARLHHTNIVDVFGNGEHQGMPFFAMRLIDGAGLDSLIRQARSGDSGSRSSSPAYRVPPTDSASVDANSSHGEPRSTTNTGYQQSRPAIPDDIHQRCEFAAKIGSQIGHALNYAHERGVVHRDLKPSNVLIDSAGTAWLTDFGLARLLESETDADLTGDGRLLGTLRYLPPESMDGPCGPAGDQYSLGLTLYEIIALRPAYERTDTAGLIADLKHVIPPRLNLLQPETPSDLVTIIHKAIDREPSARYSSAAAFAEDLSRFLTNEPILARRISAWERLSRWSRQNRGLALSLATVASLLLVAAVGSTMTAGYLRRLNTTLQTTVSDLTTTTEALTQKTSELTVSRNKAEQVATENIQLAQDALAAREEAEDSVYFSRIALADQAWHTNDVQGALDLLKKCEPVAGGIDRRRWEFGYLKSLCQQQIVHLPVWQFFSPDYVYSAAYSSDGRWLAAGSAAPWDLSSRSEVALWDMQDFRFIGITPTDQSAPQRLGFSRDSTMIGLFDSSDKLMSAIGQASSAPIPLDAVPAGAFLPDSPIIAEFDREATGSVPVNLRNRATGQLIRSLLAPGGTRGTAVSSDGRLVAIANDDSALRIWNIEDGTQTHTLRGHTNSLIATAFDPVNFQIVTTAADGIRVWDLTRNQQQQTVHVPPTFQAGEELVDFAFSADGTSLIAVEQSDEKFTIGTVKIDTGELQQLNRLSHLHIPDLLQIFNVSLSISGRRLIAPASQQQNSLLICDLENGRLQQTLSVGLAGTILASLSNDGRLVATACYIESPIVIWDAATGQRLHELPPTIGRTQEVTAAGPPAIAFSPSGDLLAVCYPYSKGVHIWDTKTGKLKSQLMFEAPQHTSSCSFSSDGTQLAATAMRDNKVVVFDVPSARERLVLSGPNGLKAAAFSPTEPRLAVAGAQGPVYLWDSESGQLILRLNRSAPGRRSYGFRPLVKWSSDGRQLAANDWTGRIDVWDSSDPATEAIDRRNIARTRSVLWSFQQAVKEHDKDPASAMKLANTYADQKDLSPPLRLARGLMWLHLGQTERAASDLCSTTSFPNEWRSMLPLLLTENFEGAGLPLLEDIARLRPEIPEFQVALADLASRKNDDVATRSYLDKAIELYEQQLAADPGNEVLAVCLAGLMERSLESSWMPLKVVSAESAAGASLAISDDSSVLASGVNADGDKYTVSVTAANPEQRTNSIAAIRLEVLPGQSLPKGGPGRHESGNFQLQEFLLFQPASESSADRTPLPFQEAWASYQYPAPDVNIAGTISTDDNRVWHIWSRFGLPSSGVFVLEKPISPMKDQPIIIELHHKQGSPLNIGRFRLSFHSDLLSMQRLREGRRLRHYQLPPFLSLAFARFSRLRPSDALQTLPAEPETHESYELALRHLLKARANRMIGDNQQTADNYNALLKVLKEHTLPPTFEWLKDEGAIEANAFLDPMQR